MGLAFSSLLRAMVIVGWLAAWNAIEDAYVCGGDSATCADIGGGLILIVVTAGVVSVWSYWDGRRLSRPYLVWIIVAVVSGTATAWFGEQSSSIAEPLGAAIVFGVLIAVPALFFAFLGRSVRKAREALGSSL